METDGVGGATTTCRLVQAGRSDTALPPGEVVELGRTWLGQQYTRCSRVHVELRYDPDARLLHLTARGSNPVVVEHVESGAKHGKKVLLTKGEKAALKQADALYLVPQDDTTRFVVHMPPPAPQKQTTAAAPVAGSQESSQASWPDIADALPLKAMAATSSSSSASAGKKRKEPSSDDDADDVSKMTTIKKTTTKTTKTTMKKPKGKDDDDEEEEEERPRKKPRCKYGSECYRKSKEHKQQFSHSPPGSPQRQEEEEAEEREEEEEEEEEEIVEKKKKPSAKKASKTDAGKEKQKTSGGGGSLAGKTVVLTGALSTRRTDMVRLLKQAGAKIGSGVSKNTDILVAGDKPGSKLTKAEALGVAVWQEEKLLKELKKAGIDEDAVGEAGEAEDAVPDVQLLLANKWTPGNNPTGWWMSEKLDGVRAYWNGSHFVSRLGNKFEAPDWFLEGLPSSSMPLDGELWKGRGMFQSAVGIVKSKGKTDKWKELTFQVFDAPGMLTEPFEARMAAIKRWFDKKGDEGAPYARMVVHTKCKGEDHLVAELARIEKRGGEGVMLRQPGSRYVGARSSTLLKVKTFHDAEARVIGHTKLAPAPGAVSKMKVGTLRCEMANGIQFSVGTGFSDYQRENPPPIGAIITYRFQELSKDGVPRFPSYVGERADMTEPKDPDPSLMAGANKDA